MLTIDYADVYYRNFGMVNDFFFLHFQELHFLQFSIIKNS